MNISEYWEKNLVHPRGLFLTFCLSFILGDILGVWGKSFLFDLFPFCLLFGWFICTRYWRYIGVLWCTWILLWYSYGSHAAETRWNTIHELSSEYHLFEGKKSILGTIDTHLFSKERSDTYRLSIDKIDNISTQKTASEWRKISIFVEIPSNLHIHEGDVISFTGKISEIIRPPLQGYSRYAFAEWGYGTVFLPLFEHIWKNTPTLFEKLRESSRGTFQKWFPKDVSWVLLGMVIGIDDFLETNVKQAFLQSGITHILVVSGSNIAFLILFVMFFLKYMHIPRWLRVSIIGIILLFYGSLVGWGISVIRATIMGILSYIIAEYWWRVSSTASLTSAGLILTILAPLWPLYDAGFWLSFGATGGIFLFRNILKKIWGKTRFPPWWLPFFSLSIWASLGSLPILIYHFWTLTIGSILMNLLIESVLWWILFSAIVYIPLAALSGTAAYIFGYLVYIPTKYIITLSGFFAGGYTLVVPENIRWPVAACLLWIYTYWFIMGDLIKHKRRSPY